jgi:hypothetical protein
MKPALRIALWIDLVVIALFGIASGLYKVLGGEADVTLYAALGITPIPMAVIGAAQAVAGGGLFVAKARPYAAVVLAGINLLASAVLFVNGVQPFGWISLLFVAMALAPLALRPAAGARG